MADKDRKSSEKQADRSADEPSRSQDEEKHGLVHSPYGSADPAFAEENADLDPTQVVGRYAMQPDPNDDRPAPQPVVVEGMKEAPADDDEGTPAPGAPDAKVVEGG